MHTRHSRKAKSAAADFVKRVISGHDTSPVPSSKPKSQIAKAKQAIGKSGDLSRSPSRGRSPATASKSSPAAKAKGAKVSASTSKQSGTASKLPTSKLPTATAAKTSSSTTKSSSTAKTTTSKEVSKSSKVTESKELSQSKGVGSKSAPSNSSKKNEKPDKNAAAEKSDKTEESFSKSDSKSEESSKTEAEQVVPEVITIKSEDESSEDGSEPPKDEEKEKNEEVVEIKSEDIKEENIEGEAEEKEAGDSPETELEPGEVKQEPADEQQVPTKRGRGRPRKYPKGGGPGKTNPAPKPVPKPVPSTPPPPTVEGKRPRGRPRKYPIGSAPVIYKSKSFTQSTSAGSSPKINKKLISESRYYYSKFPRLPMSGGIGALTIKIKDDYMLQEGGMISPRHPTIMCEQDEFFKIFGLIKKSELDEMNRRTHTLHRAAGGKLRRMIKPKISPEMVYRNFMLNKSQALGAVPDEWDSSDEYDESSPMARLAKSQSAPTSPDHSTLLGSASKVSLLPKQKSLLKSLKAGAWTSPEEPSAGPKKQWLKPPPKTPKRSSIEDALEAAKSIPKDVMKPKKTDKPPLLKKQKSDPGGNKSKVLKLESKSKSLEPVKNKSVISGYKFKPSGGFRPLAPPPKPIEEEEDPNAKPSRRSARNRGGQRKQWWHLLRANPDEYIPDHKWDEENAVKEKKKQDRMKRKLDDDDDVEEIKEEEEEEGEDGREPGEVVIPKPKKKRRKKIMLTDEEIEILEAEERAMEERERKEREEAKKEKKTINSPVKSALKRKLETDPSESAKTQPEDSARPSSPSVIAKKKKKKKKKLKEKAKFHFMARVDNRGSVLTIHKGSKFKEYMIFDSDFNLVSLHDDSNMYQLTANAVVQLAKQEGWANLGQEVVEIVLPNKLVKEKLRSQICERMNPASVVSLQEEKERACIIPHMCKVCWINDHMYCTNMKRTGRNLAEGGSCLHYTLCSHYRNLSPKETYARYATVAQFGSGRVTKNFSISRLKEKDFANSSRTLSQEGTSITISGGKLLSPVGGTTGTCLKDSPVTITVNNAAKAEMTEKNPPKEAEDLVCHEELGESDSEPTTPSGEYGKDASLLSKHLWVRARQIAQSLGFSSVKEAMESLKKNSELKASEHKEDLEQIIELYEEREEKILVQEYVEVEVHENSDSDSDMEEEESRKKYGVPLSSKVRSYQHAASTESVIKIHLMPVLDRSRSKFYIKCKDRKVMKVQFSGRAQYHEEEQEWKVENDTYTITDVTKKFNKKMIKLAKANDSSLKADKSPLSKQVGFVDSHEKGGVTLTTTTTSSSGGSPRVIWSSELDLEKVSPGRSKSSPDQPPAKKQKLNSGDSITPAGTPKRKPEELGQGDSFRSPDAESRIRNDRSADSSPCLSQGSAGSHTSTSSAQGQQLLMASPVKLPKPSTSLPSELQNHVTAGKDGAQTLTFTTKDIRQCKPELVQYIKSANLIDMIQKTLMEERNSIEKLLKDGDGDVSRLKDNLEQNECLLLAVRSEAKEVKIKLVDLEMNVITDQNKAARLERKREKLTNSYNHTFKKMEAFKKAMEKVEGIIESTRDNVPTIDANAQEVSYTILELPDGSTIPVTEGATVALNPLDGSTMHTSGGILTAASAAAAAAQLPRTVAMETIVQPPVSVNL